MCLNIYLKKIIGFFLLSMIFTTCLAEKTIIFPADHDNHPTMQHEIWMFSGETETDDNKTYAYVFTLKRDFKEWYVFINIVDLATHKAVLHNEFEQLQTDEDKIIKDNRYQIGKAFMQYNAISDSWLFGLSGQKNSFNFRVKGVRHYVLNGTQGYLDANKKNDHAQASYSAQSMNMNGQLTLDSQSRFVSGKNTWFEHRWREFSEQNTQKYALITCRFSDNTGLMLYEWFGKKDLWPTRIKTGTYQDALDHKTIVTNFSLAKSAKMNAWFVSVPALNMSLKMPIDADLSFYEVVRVQDTHTKKPKKGYCFVNQKGF